MSNYETENTEAMEPLFMVHVAGKPAPVVYHEHLPTAVAEATRLANKERAEVAVLQVVAFGRPQTDAPLDWTFANNVHRHDCTTTECGADEDTDDAEAALRRVIDLLFEGRR